MYGSLASYGKSHYTSDVDLNVCVKNEVSEEQFDRIKERIFEMAKPLAESLGRGVEDIIQVNYKSKTQHPNYQKSSQILYGNVPLDANGGTPRGLVL